MRRTISITKCFTTKCALEDACQSLSRGTDRLLAHTKLEKWACLVKIDGSLAKIQIKNSESKLSFLT